MKKILLIASRPLANDGLTKIETDVIKYSIDSIEFEVACGFDYDFDNLYVKQLKKQQIKFHALPSKKKPFTYMREIYKLVKRERYDGVYIHGNSAMMFMEAIPAKLTRTRVITHCHNTKSDYPLVHYIAKPFFNRAVDVKIGCSLWASQWAYCGKNIITIINGIEIDLFKYDKKKRNEVRKLLDWESNKVVGHIGRFSKQKNHKKLIDVFSEMYKKDDSMRFLLIGDGDLKENIENQIRILGLSEVVCIIDKTEAPQDYMNAMDIMIIPSLFEGLCLVALEAQANGLPVLIDEFFTPETCATDLVKILKLHDPDGVWAESAIQLMQEGRHDVSKQLYEKKMDKEDMMKSIWDILVK